MTLAGFIQDIQGRPRPTVRIESMGAAVQTNAVDSARTVAALLRWRFWAASFPSEELPSGLMVGNRPGRVRIRPGA
jgi:hypothetical protein